MYTNFKGFLGKTFTQTDKKSYVIRSIFSVFFIFIKINILKKFNNIFIYLLNNFSSEVLLILMEQDTVIHLIENKINKIILKILMIKC